MNRFGSSRVASQGQPEHQAVLRRHRRLGSVGRAQEQVGNGPGAYRTSFVGITRQPERSPRHTAGKSVSGRQPAANNNDVRRGLDGGYNLIALRGAAMNQTIRFCTTPDGVQLVYAVSGDGPPLVMSATWVTHLEHQWRSLAWRPWLDAFTSEHKVLRHDSRGCGLSDRTTKNLSFESWVRDLECVVEAADFRHFALVGTCWGGPIAIEYAVRHPERVSRLVLYGTYAQGRLRRTCSPSEVDEARIWGDLTRVGWGQEDHDLIRVWASLFQPGGSADHVRSWCDQQRAATPGRDPVEITSGELFRVDVNGELKVTRMEFREFLAPLKGRENRGQSGEFYSADGYWLRDGLRAAIGAYG